MSTLNEVRERLKWNGMPHMWNQHDHDIRFLLVEVDRLQSELSALKTSSGETFRLAVFHQDRANKAEAKRDALKQAQGQRLRRVSGLFSVMPCTPMRLALSGIWRTSAGLNCASSRMIFVAY